MADCPGGCHGTRHRPLTAPGDQMMALLAWVQAQDDDTMRRFGEYVEGEFVTKVDWKYNDLLAVFVWLTVPNLTAAVAAAVRAEVTAS